MKDVKPILKSLGLLESEIQTYMAAFKNGASTVIELAKVTNLSRQATYSAIEVLTDRGLMTSFLRGKKRFYAAEHPDRLLTYASRKQDEMREMVSDLKRSLPELELQMGGERPQVRVFEGQEGLRAIFEDIQKSRPKELFELTDSEAFEKIVDDKDLIPVRKELEKSKTHVWGIYTLEEKDEKDKFKFPANYIYLPKEKSGFHSDIMVYKDKVGLISLKGKFNSVIIENKELADGMRILFKLALKK